MENHTRQRVLVTGMAGTIGGITRRFLSKKYHLMGLDLIPVEECSSVVADLSNLEAIRPAFDGKEIVVHLGGERRPSAPWESVLKNNIVGTQNVFEASRDAGVKRIIFASSNHVVGFYPLKEDPYKAVFDGRLEQVRRPFPMLNAEMLRPDSLYGVSKVFGESLGSYYHDQYGISVICLRIGWVMTPDDPIFFLPDRPDSLPLWLSHRDTAQLIERSIEAPASVGFTIVYGMSKNSLLIWDIETARETIGFDPMDGIGETADQVPTDS